MTGLKNFTGGLSASVVDVSQTVDGVDLSVEAVTLTGKAKLKFHIKYNIQWQIVKC